MENKLTHLTIIFLILLHLGQIQYGKKSRTKNYSKLKLFKLNMTLVNHV